MNKNDEIDNDFKDIFMTEFNEIRKRSKKAHMIMSSVLVCRNIDCLHPGKGYDGIHSLLLKNSNCELIQNLVVLINCVLKHKYIPINMLKGEIKPIVKEKNGNLNSWNN